MSDVAGWAAGTGVAAAIALVARAAGALSTSGAAAAVVAGSVAVAAGWDWAVMLVLYFASSSALSRIRPREREARTAGRIEKSGTRDAVQVAANGGVFAVAAVAFAATHDPLWQVIGAAGLAASAADTWATEIGTLSRAEARSIVTGRAMPPGTSGAVTALGLMAGFAGAALVAGIAAGFGWPRESVHAAIIGGVAGCMADSVLGASLQSRRRCPACGTATEQRRHRCGAATVHDGGISWLDNDAVNAVSTVVGALLGTLLTGLA